MRYAFENIVRQRVREEIAAVKARREANLSAREATAEVIHALNVLSEKLNGQNAHEIDLVANQVRIVTGYAEFG